MQKIDKSDDKILSTNYKAWVDDLDAEGKDHPTNSRHYYDVVMNLYRCQKGVCAYTERHLCLPENYAVEKWQNGRYISVEKIQHLGELEHFDAENKKERFWNWDNLFMIDSKINSDKRNRTVVSFLKPDLPDYSPEKYFDYDDESHFFRPNTDIEDDQIVKDIEYMINEVLFLNHAMIKYERENYIKELKYRIANGEHPTVYKFFTAVKMSEIF